MQNSGRNLIIWLAIFSLLMILVKAAENGMDQGGSTNVSFSDFLNKTDAGEVSDVLISKSEDGETIIRGHFSDGSRFMTNAPEYPGLIDRLNKNNVSITSKKERTNILVSLFMTLLPFVIIIGLWYFFFMRSMNSSGRGGGGAMGFGKSKARMLTEKEGKKTFEDVAGIDEAKEELEEIVDFLKDPSKFTKLGGKIPKGCLLVGPPGTGKTLLARAVAGEAGVPFFTISGSDFVEMFVGVGASRVRDMFEQGKKNAPCIIFIDEIDAVGRSRGVGIGGGNDEREQTLNQMLVEMDGFESNEGVIILAATNRPDVLDPALLRPGRFDRQITVPNPDIIGRHKILDVHLKNVPIAPDVDSHVIARGTPGFSGADLANLVNEAALLAARNDKKVVTMKEMEAAKDKVMMGAERKSMIIKDSEKKKTAYHEAGHAIVAVSLPASDPVHKATIIPRGRALGMVMRLPEEDEFSYLRDKMYANLAVAMAGRAAEEITFGYDKVSSGAAGDISYATDLANAMVTKWGMSEEIGPVYCDAHDEKGYKTRISQQKIAKIDVEIRRLIEEGQEKATQIIEENKEGYIRIAEALLEHETLTGDEIKDLMAGKDIERKRSQDSQPKTAKSSLPSSKEKSDKKSVDDSLKEDTSEKKKESKPKTAKSSLPSSKKKDNNKPAADSAKTGKSDKNSKNTEDNKEQE